MWQELKLAVRGLARSPGFSGAALLTLALGIGATAAIFSVVKAVLLTPLPYAEPDRRVEIFSKWVDFDKTWLSDQEIVDYRTMLRTISAVGAWTWTGQSLTGDGDPLRVTSGLVTANLFDVLGARPMLGRMFTEAEDRPNGPPVAVLGYPLWQARYGGDPGIVGRTILINDVPVEVIGVMPEGFRLPTDFTSGAAQPTSLWRPLQLDMQDLSRGNHGYYAAGVLAPGATAASATDELRALTKRFTEDGLYPEPMQFSAFAVSLDDEIRGGVRPAMRLLMGAVAFLLLIACANVANLLLVRADARLREMAVRTAVGASPGRLVRQLFVESLVLAVGGSVAGMALGAVALRVLLTVDPTSLPPLSPVSLDLTVMAVTLVIGIATTLVFGLAPALRTLGFNLVEALREGSHQATIGGARQRVRGLLVVGEVALAVVLVIGAGLMIRSLAALGRIGLGFNPDHLLTMQVSLPAARYDSPERVADFYRQLNERVRALPGVVAAGAVRSLPLASTIGDWGLDVEGYEESPGHNAKGDWQIATDGAFEAMGTRLMRGRWFTAADTLSSMPVAVVNETLARTYWKNPDDAVGGRLRLGSDGPWAQVIGIVADERHNGITGVVKEKFFIPHAQWAATSTGNPMRAMTLTIRTSGDPMGLANTVRAQVREMDPNLPVANVRPMTEVVAASMATERLTGFLLGAFAFIALSLAAVGIYGVLAYLVARRSHEIGIRMALGANRGEVLAMIVRHGLVLAGTGALAGLVAAFGVTRLMQGLLYEVRPVDPATFVAVPIGLLVVAAAAALLPAWRASRVNPVVALRSE